MKKLFMGMALIFLSLAGFSQVSVKWDLLENNFKVPASHSGRFTLSNDSGKTIQAGWKLYFNTIFLTPEVKTLSPGFRIKHLQGDFFVLEGAPQTGVLNEGQNIEIAYEAKDPFYKNSHAPEGLIFLQSNGDFFEVKSYAPEKISAVQLAEMAKGTSFPVPTAENIPESEKGLSELADTNVPPFLPTPKSWKYTGPEMVVKNAGLAVVGNSEFVKATTFLLQAIKSGYKPQVDRSEAPINLKLNKVEGLPQEGYRIKISGRRIDIDASGIQGALYGAESFLALMPPIFWQKPAEEIYLPQVEIEDYPSFSYRGFFLDVARNFQPKSEILKILDLMAFYKLNVFHFNLVNDEGWRIEIPGLPELTEFGSKRGFSVDEQQQLWPYYASGANPQASPTGSGFYTQEDFKEIIRHAKNLGIEVIPEIGVPAHSRAAILSMERRFENYSKLGDQAKAMEFRLADPKDESVYLSAQLFRGNTVCVCQESTYRFYEKIVDEIQRMYLEAGVPLTTWHSGGDEVPQGAWSDSPVCALFLAENPDVKRSELLDYFRVRISDILKERGLEMAGWEEIGQTHSAETILPNLKLANQRWRLHAWNAVAGWGGEDMAYRLANAGYPVVISPSSNFYFDLAYNWDPDERGHTWSGVVDTYQAWKTVPGKLYLSHDQTIDGNPWDWEEQSKRFEMLSEAGRKNIVGVSGQVWTETVKGPKMLEYYLLPKMLGFVERAWNADPNWSTLSTEPEMKQARTEEWNVFVNTVFKRELPRLDVLFGGFNSRKPSWELKN